MTSKAGIKKQQLKHEMAKKKTLQQFRKTYIALVDTLNDIYGSSVSHLKTVTNKVASYTESEWKQIIALFEKQLGINHELVERNDSSVFKKNLPCLMELCIPQLWNENKFTERSQQYIWLYLVALLKDARAYMSTPSPTSNSTESKRDIRPPEGTHAGSEFKEVYDKLPTTLISKVRGIAEKYSQRIESGEESIESLKFSEISNELFQEIDPNEMKEVIANVGGMLQGMNGGGGGGGLSGLTSIFEQMNRK